MDALKFSSGKVMGMKEMLEWPLYAFGLVAVWDVGRGAELQRRTMEDLVNELRTAAMVMGSRRRLRDPCSAGALGLSQVGGATCIH